MLQGVKAGGKSLGGLTLIPAQLAGAFVLRTLGVLATYLLLDVVLSRLLQLPAGTYQRPILAVEVLRHIGPLLCVGIVVVIFCLFRWGWASSYWRDLQHGPSTRIFVTFLCTLAAWPVVTYGYNYYFDQGHYLDRLLIVLLLLAVWWRPVFVLPFIALVYVAMGQFIEPPLGGSILPHKLQLTRAVSVFAAAFLVHTVTGERRTDHYLLLTCCLVAASYWVAGLAKLRLGWVSFEQLFTAPLAAYSHGWLGGMPLDQVMGYANFLAEIDSILQFATIALELACIAFVVHRNVTIGLLIGVIAFHLAVFALIGFFFWTWIGLDAALLVMIMRKKADIRGAVPAFTWIGMSLVLIAAGPLWAKPPWLGWYETPLNYVYRIDAVTSRDGVHRIHPDFFAPYEDVFTMASFQYLVEQHATLVQTYGVSHDRDIVSALRLARSAEDVFALERNANTRFDPERASVLFDFIQRFVCTRNVRGDALSLLTAARSPPQFWNQGSGIRELGQTQIDEVRVVEETYFYDGSSLEVIRELEVGRVSIPAGTECR